MKATVPELFRLIRDRGATLIPLLGKVKLRRCKVADAEHEGNSRQYMHYAHHKRTVCYAAATEELSLEWKVGLIAHELGHAAAEFTGFWHKHSEPDANRLGSAILGGVVNFRGPKRLEWATAPAWLKKSLRGGSQ